MQALRHHKTLLCIDDEANALAGWCLYLQGAGYVVMGAATPAEGLQVFATTHIDAVVLDYSMPDLNGDGVAATMKKIKREVPIVMFTGFSDLGCQARADVDVFVTKGCDPSILLKAVDEMLGIVGDIAVA